MASFLGFLTGESDTSSRIGQVLLSNGKIEDQLIAGLSIEDNVSPLRISVTPANTDIDVVLLKNAKAHAYLDAEMQLPNEPQSICHVQLDQLNTESHLRLFANSFDWKVVQKNIYRYSVLTGKQTIVRTVIHEHLATEVIW
ncbi:hypothetical protein DS901_02295 [Loktanella sp. D2R18]|uniref:hypothetical protein n=1 Tax=Rhodobacterales TaxID=204455 RepID=UPI000E018F29|nr:MULTISPECIES: hypothetical protein [Rhodobacterales]MDO6589877.1 hypothetical protein [Yoonia sp. 1_MG-2023]RBW45970.1 hypothetical protein DS901_02295 [Loktanella sp. D2R18]